MVDAPYYYPRIVSHLVQTDGDAIEWRAHLRVWDGSRGREIDVPMDFLSTIKLVEDAVTVLRKLKGQ